MYTDYWRTLSDVKCMHLIIVSFYFSISIWPKLYTGGHRQTQTTSSLFFLMPRYQTDLFIHREITPSVSLWPQRTWIIPRYFQMNYNFCFWWFCILSSVHYSCPSGCGSEHSNLRAAPQAGREDSRSAHRERQHQHWRERSAALSSWWVLHVASRLCLRISLIDVH